MKLLDELKMMTLQAAANELGPGDVNAHMRFLVDRADIAKMRDDGLLKCGPLDNFGSEYAWGSEAVSIEITKKGRKWLLKHSRWNVVESWERVLLTKGK